MHVLWTLVATLGCQSRTSTSPPSSASTTSASPSQLVSTSINPTSLSATGTPARPAHAPAPASCDESDTLDNTFVAEAVNGLAVDGEYTVHKSTHLTELFHVPGTYRSSTSLIVIEKQFTLTSATHFIRLPTIPGKVEVILDKVRIARLENRPAVLERTLQPGLHTLELRVQTGSWQGGLRIHESPVFGELGTKRRGDFTHEYVVDGKKHHLRLHVPRCRRLNVSLPLVVALPGYSGNIYGFDHSALMLAADRIGFAVLVPETGGNTLYTGASEDGVLSAINEVSRHISVDADRVILTGVSMGGSGALQVGYHYPHLFSAVVAFYPDTLYELHTYVGPILKTEANAAQYSVLKFPENGRNLPTILVHARDDRVVPVSESTRLMDAARLAGLSQLTFADVPIGGHTMQVFEDHVEDIFVQVQSSKRAKIPERVSFRTSTSRYRRAYWLSITPTEEGRFAFVDANFHGQVVTFTSLEKVKHVDVNVADLGVTELELIYSGLAKSAQTVKVSVRKGDELWRVEDTLTGKRAKPISPAN